MCALNDNLVLPLRDILFATRGEMKTDNLQMAV